MDLLERAAAAPPERAGAILETALRAGADRMWVHRNAARIYATHVKDRASAFRVVEEIAPLTCIEWRLKAAAWCDLDEREFAVRCLERAAKNARTASDLCNVALGYGDTGYADEARLMIDGAAQIATHAMDAWIVASCYRDAFRDATRGREVLVAGLRDAVGVGELLGFARAFAAHDAEPAELEAIVDRAKNLASTVQAWIDISRAHHLILLDPPEALMCVTRAAQLSTSPQDERAIAVARGLVDIQILDDERPKLPPSKLLAPGARSFMWDRDPNRLLAWLRARIPRARIDTLSRPARFVFHDDLVTLLDLQRTGNIPHPLPAFLDVLREYATFDDELRAFACTLLCVDDAAAAIPDGAEREMIALCTSCLALGPDAVAGAASLFAGLADAYEANQSTTVMGYLVLCAEVALALCAAWLDPTDPRIPQVFDRALAEAPAYPRFKPAMWGPLARRVLVHPRLQRYAAQFGD